MSNTEHTDAEPQSGGSTVLKSRLDALIAGGQEVGLDGEFLWPVPPRSLALLYRTSSEHGRAIRVKAESAFGGGLMGGGAEKVEALCNTGTAALFIGLGIDLETYGNAFLQIIRSSDESRIIGFAPPARDHHVPVSQGLYATGFPAQWKHQKDHIHIAGNRAPQRGLPRGGALRFAHMDRG